MSKRWYAVTHGDDLDYGTGSHVKREAYKIARQMRKYYPGEEIRIVLCRDDSDYCEGVIVVYDADGTLVDEFRQ